MAKSNTQKLRERIGAKRTRKTARANMRRKAYGAASRVTGASVAAIGRNTSAGNIKRRAAFKMTAARKAALKKAQLASAKARTMRARGTQKVKSVLGIRNTRGGRGGM